MYEDFIAIKLQHLELNTLSILLTKLQSSTTDDIIFSGVGPADCFSDDEDECITATSDTDDIVTPNIVITRLTTPKTEPM